MRNAENWYNVCKEGDAVTGTQSPAVMSITGATHRTYSFGEFTLDLDRGALLSAGEDIKLRPKSFEVLRYLVEHDGRLVSKDELLDAIWGNTVVTEDSVTQCLIDIRRALHDQSQKTIRTVPRRGYVFELPVTKRGGRVEASSVVSPKTIVISLLCVAAIIFAYDNWWMSGPPITSVAVLPLDSLSDDPEQEYFADGMTDVLSGALAQIDGLQVISRTSAMRYKTTDKPMREIARELDVDALIEGSVQQAGDDVRFTLQLIDGRTDRHIWAGSYQRHFGDSLTLQGEIAVLIADAIDASLSPRTEARLTRHRTAKSDAVRMWVVGNHHLKGLSEDSFRKALQAFEEAVRRDPEFADAHAGIAQAYASLGGWHAAQALDTVLPLAKAAAEKAIRLDPDLAEAHFALAFVHVLGWDWEAAEREFRKGSELNPSDSNGLTGFANFLSSMGQFEESVNIATRAVKVDPLSPFTHNELGSSLWFTGRTRAALAKYQEALQLDPEFFQTQWIIAGHHIISGDYDKAMPFLDKLKRDYESLSPVMIGQLGGNYARVGHRDDALEILNYLLKRSESEYMRASAVATVYLGLKEYDEALAWLEIAYEQRDILLIWLREEPLFDGLRSDARFQDLVARMNFPDTN